MPGPFQRPIKLLDPQWNAMEYQKAIFCTCCENGYGADYLLSVAAIFHRSFNHKTRHPTVFA